MSKSTINEREFELINIIGSQIAANQRDLSRHLDLSLGMTNMLIKRLISKGYIRIKQLTKKKVEYILTPKGFAEKMKKSIKYTMKTIDSIGLIRKRLKAVLAPFVKNGEKNFIILGRSDFAFLVEIILKNLGVADRLISHIEETPTERFEGILLICREELEGKDFINDNNMVNLLEELAKDDNLLQGIS